MSYLFVWYTRQDIRGGHYNPPSVINIEGVNNLLHGWSTGSNFPLVWRITVENLETGETQEFAKVNDAWPEIPKWKEYVYEPKAGKPTLEI